jgi:hypothetical protein
LKTEKITSFQVSGVGMFSDLNILVDKVWINDNRIYFKVKQMISNSENFLRKEKESNIYSINERDIFSIRCKLLLNAPLLKS